MALEDEVQLRYSPQIILELTQSDPDATAVSGATLARAARDVEADFEIYAGVAYDNTNDKHVGTAVDGVILKLMKWKAQTFDARNQLDEEWIGANGKLIKLGNVTGRARVTPKSRSLLTPSAEVTGSETVRPFFDPNKVRDVVPEVIQDRERTRVS